MVFKCQQYTISHCPLLWNVVSCSPSLRSHFLRSIVTELHVYDNATMQDSTPTTFYTLNSLGNLIHDLFITLSSNNGAYALISSFFFLFNTWPTFVPLPPNFDSFLFNWNITWWFALFEKTFFNESFRCWFFRILYFQMKHHKFKLKHCATTHNQTLSIWVIWTLRCKRQHILDVQNTSMV